MKTDNKIIAEPAQQGDVLLLPIPKLPDNCKPFRKHPRGLVIAEGEAHNHAHRFDGDDGNVALMEAPDGRRFVVNSGDKPAALVHEEHKPITVAPGIHEIGIVREKDWFSDMTRNVVD